MLDINNNGGRVPCKAEHIKEFDPFPQKKKKQIRPFCRLLNDECLIAVGPHA